MTALTIRRNSVISQIQNNPFWLVVRRPSVSTSPGSGSPRKGSSYSTVQTNREARVAQRSSTIPDAQNETPQISDKFWFLLADFRTTVYKGDQFEDGNGFAWEITEVTPLAKFGGVIGYECALRQISATA